MLIATVLKSASKALIIVLIIGNRHKKRAINLVLEVRVMILSSMSSSSKKSKSYQSRLLFIAQYRYQAKTIKSQLH